MKKIEEVFHDLFSDITSKKQRDSMRRTFLIGAVAGIFQTLEVKDSTDTHEQFQKELMDILSLLEFEINDGFGPETH